MGKWIPLPGFGLTPILTRIVALNVALHGLEALILTANLFKDSNHSSHRRLKRS